MSWREDFQRAMTPRSGFVGQCTVARNGPPPLARRSPPAPVDPKRRNAPLRALRCAQAIRSRRHTTGTAMAINYLEDFAPGQRFVGAMRMRVEADRIKS